MHLSESINPNTTYFEGDLPAIPSVVAELIALTEQADVNVEDVRRTLEQDPALCLAVLRISNSPYFGMRHKISDIQLALVILGMREVRTIALGISTYDALRNGGQDAAIVQRLWSNALQVGGLSKRIANTYTKSDATTAFIGGLLTNVGKAFFLKRLPEHYAKLLRKHALDWRALIAGEEGLFGCNHLEIAAALLTRWNLPPVLTDIVWRHYPDDSKPIQEAVDSDMTVLVRLARYLVDANAKSESHPACEDIDTWRFIEKIAGNQEQQEFFQRLQQLAEDTRALPVIEFDGN